MALNKYVVSIFNNTTEEHVLEVYHAQSPVIAAYIVADNELGTEFPDDDERPDFDLSEAAEEFRSYGLYLNVIAV